MKNLTVKKVSILALMWVYQLKPYDLTVVDQNLASAKQRS